MPLSALVITFGSDESLADAARAAIAREPAVELGPPSGRRRPIVVDTRNRRDDKRIWEWIHALPGVDHVDVVFIHFDRSDDDRSLETPTPGRDRRRLQLTAETSP